MVLRQLKIERHETSRKCQTEGTVETRTGRKPIGIRYFNTCAEFYMCKAEYEYIMAEIAAEETE